ncbi:hypothetical protein KI387_000889, partial [Taxus chinensis]
RGRGGYAQMNRHMQELQRQVAELTGEVTRLRRRHANGDANPDSDIEEEPPSMNEGGDEETLNERPFEERLIKALEGKNDDIKINVRDYGGGLRPEELIDWLNRMEKFFEWKTLSEEKK